MKVGGLREMPTLRDAVRRRRRAPIPVQRTSDAPYPEAVERRTVPRAPLHFQRIELKYFLPYRYLDHFVERVSRRTDVDPYLVKEGLGRTRYPVTSLYFDSYDLAAWREKEDGQFYRRKIRLRTYTEEFAEDTPCFLEIKRRLDTVVLKDHRSAGGGAHLGHAGQPAAPLPSGQRRGPRRDRARSRDDARLVQ